MKLLDYKKLENEVYAKVRTSISQELIAQNLFDYYYLFFAEKDQHYTSDLPFHVN